MISAGFYCGRTTTASDCQTPSGQVRGDEPGQVIDGYERKESEKKGFKTRVESGLTVMEYRNELRSADELLPLRVSSKSLHVHQFHVSQSPRKPTVVYLAIITQPQQPTAASRHRVMGRLNWRLYYSFMRSYRALIGGAQHRRVPSRCESNLYCMHAMTCGHWSVGQSCSCDDHLMHLAMKL